MGDKHAPWAVLRCGRNSRRLSSRTKGSPEHGAPRRGGRFPVLWRRVSLRVAVSSFVIVVSCYRPGPEGHQVPVARAVCGFVVFVVVGLAGPFCPSGRRLALAPRAFSAPPLLGVLDCACDVPRAAVAARVLKCRRWDWRVVLSARVLAALWAVAAPRGTHFRLCHSLTRDWSRGRAPSMAAS